MIEINLVPDVKQELLRAKRTRSIVVTGAITTIIVTVGLILLLCLYIYGVQNIRHFSLDNEIKMRNQQLSRVEDLSKILTIQNQLAVINDLNNNKTIDSRVFDLLSAVVPPAPNEVQLSRINVDNTGGTINIEGQTRAYESMEIFKKTLDSVLLLFKSGDEINRVNLVKELSMGEVSYGSNSNGEKVIIFNLTFTYIEELFSPEISDIGFQFSVNGNVTDSYLGIPRSIYTTPAMKETGQ